MIKVIIYDPIYGDVNNPLATLLFDEKMFPNEGDNITIDNIKYVVRKKEYIINEDNDYNVALQVRKYISNEGGY